MLLWSEVDKNVTLGHAFIQTLDKSAFMFLTNVNVFNFLLNN